jgi:diacylglycerol kinase (ATP)
VLTERTAKNHLFFINPVSFPQKEKLDMFVAEVDRAFQKLRGHRYAVMISRFPRDAIGVVRRFAQDNGREGNGVRVYAVGGDGILFDCLNAVFGLDNVELASIPYGTHNDFLRTFGDEALPLFRNVEHIAAAPSIATDVINCDSNYALNYMTSGMESVALARSLSLVNKLGKRRYLARRFMSAIYCVVFAAEAMRSAVTKQEYTITMDGENYSGAYMTMSVANGVGYGGDRRISFSSVPDDGLLNVTICNRVSLAKALRAIPGYGNGGYEPKGAVTRREAKVISVSSENPVFIALDGELFFDSAVNVSVAPSAVRFIAPEHLAYEKRSVREYNG